MAYVPDLNSEYHTGDQSSKYRRRRGTYRYPHWQDVESWRRRWTPEKVQAVLMFYPDPRALSLISEATGFPNIETTDNYGRNMPALDLRGLDLALLPLEDRHFHFSIIGRQDVDLSYAHLEGARLTDLDLSYANCQRACLQKATLRRVNFTGADLTKAHLEDADLRDAILVDARLAHIRYTADGFWYRGTVLMETHINRAMYVDPLLERCAKDQYFLYVMKYRNRRNPLFRIVFFLWWLTSNYGKSPLLWLLWSVLFPVGFALRYYQLGEASFNIANLKWNLQTMIYYSVVTFTTLGFGDIAPNTQEAAWWVTAEVIVGYLMLGGLLAILAAKIAQRS